MSVAHRTAPIVGLPRQSARVTALLLGGVLVLAASVLVAPPAYAAPVGPDANGISYETTGSEASVTGYTQVGTITDVVIPDTISDGGNDYTVTSIGYRAFGSAGLTSITIPNTVTTIGELAFISNDLTTVDLPGSLTVIGVNSFRHNSLDTVSIPDSVTSIGSYAFDDNGMSVLHLGSSVSTFGDHAFNNNSLTSVTIPSTVTAINERAFWGNSLSSVVFQGSPPSVFDLASNEGSLGDGTGLTVYYPSQYADDYAPSGATTWQGYTTAVGATLSYDLGGHGAAIDSVTVVPNATVPAGAAPPTDPAATGFTFIGWFTASTGGTAFDFATPLATDATAFAQWASTGTTPAADPTLPSTGGDHAPLVATGSLFLLLGAAAVYWVRRRTHHSHR